MGHPAYSAVTCRDGIMHAATAMLRATNHTQEARATLPGTMKTSRTIFWLGLVIYATSFFLVGMESPGNAATRSPMRGYTCAWTALIAPWAFAGLWSSGILAVFMPAIVISGLINPLFIAAVIVLFRHRRRPFLILRVIVLSMIPFCWISFLLLRPREGFVLWTLGMLLVLFSGYEALSTASSNSSLNPTMAG
jgi:hypothetical protein